MELERPDREKDMPQTIDLTGLPRDAVEAVVVLVQHLRTRVAHASDLDSAQIGRELLSYRDREKRTLGASFRDLAHQGHKY